MRKALLAFALTGILSPVVYAENTSELVVKIPVDTTSIQTCIDSGADSLRASTLDFDDATAEAILSGYCERMINKMEADNQMMLPFTAPGQEVKNPPAEISLDLSGSLSRGNETETIIDAELDIKKRIGRHKVGLAASLERKDREDESEEVMAIVFSDDIQVVNEKWVVNATATVLKDEVKGEKLRTEEVIGIGYEFADKAYNENGDSLKYGVGVGHKYLEDFDGNSDHEAMVNQTVSFEKGISDHVSVEGVLVLKNNPSEFDDYEVVSGIALNIKEAIVDTVNFNVGVESNYVNRPVPGKVNHDLKFFMGLEWRPEIKRSLF